jgi:putative heme-binding domain-containing protein
MTVSKVTLITTIVSILALAHAEAKAQLLNPLTLPASAAGKSIAMQLPPGLKAVVIDSDDRESFLGLQLDSAGRLFVGCREALFVYEPVAGGLYQQRQLLFRFPKDAWVYDIAIRGDDLYVSTHTAIYFLAGAVKKRDGIIAKRLVWGLPMMRGFDTHQGIHGLALGPEGDIYFSNGDEIINYGDFKRPDHWSHWTYFHGSKSTEVNGCGGLFRISPDGEEFSVMAAGTRNSCGIAFDHAWNLFTSDNDHESMPADYVPGRLLHVTPGAYFSWPRGWMAEKTPWRADLLETMHPDVGRYVPTGMAYYDDNFLPEPFRHCLYVAEWGKGKLLRYPLRAQGASFKVVQIDFLAAPPTVRPVGVAVGRGGRLFVTLCHMKGNEASPAYASDLIMVTRDTDSDAAPFEAYEETSAPVEKLYAELASDSWHRRYRAHIELLRRGPAACKQAAERLDKAPQGSAEHTHLLWLTGAAGMMEKVEPLINSTNSETRHQAIRAFARFSPAPQRAIFDSALDDANPQVVQVALATLRDRFDAAPLSKIIALARGSDRLLRQTAIQLLASNLDTAQIQTLCEASGATDRLVGILCCGQRLTVPTLSGRLPADWPTSPMKNSVAFVGEKVDLISGSFTVADVWARRSRSPDDERLFALLERRLDDASGDNAKEAAFFLRLLKDPRTDAQATKVLGLPPELAVKGTPLKGAVSTGIIELPEAFKAVDWPQEVARGDAKVGAKLYNERGCATCHASKPADAGGGGPSLAGAATRFTIPYLVESVITPNKTVSPIYKWTMVTKKSGDSIAGLITSETGAEIELLLPTGIRQAIKKADIAKRELQDRSPMPEGIITTPAELRDLLSYLMTLKDGR